MDVLNLLLIPVSAKPENAIDAPLPDLHWCFSFCDGTASGTASSMERVTLLQCDYFRTLPGGLKWNLWDTVQSWPVGLLSRCIRFFDNKCLASNRERRRAPLWQRRRQRGPVPARPLSLTAAAVCTKLSIASKYGFKSVFFVKEN